MADEKKIIKIPYHYIKNNDFKTAFASGIWGQVNPAGLIDVNFFTERTPLPRKTVSVIEDGKVTEDAGEREVKDGIIRELQFGVLMNVNTAKFMIKWLQEKIDAIEKHNQK